MDLWLVLCIGVCSLELGAIVKRFGFDAELFSAFCFKRFVISFDSLIDLKLLIIVFSSRFVIKLVFNYVYVLYCMCIQCVRVFCAFYVYFI